MNIQSTTAQRATSTRPGIGDTESSTKTAKLVKLESPSDSFVSSAASVVVGAAEGLLYGALSNSVGWAPVVLGASVGGAANGAISGRRSGKALDKELVGLGVPESQVNFTRSQTLQGGLGGFADGFSKTALITGLTQISGGNLAVGAATGAVLAALDVF